MKTNSISCKESIITSGRDYNVVQHQFTERGIKTKSISRFELPAFNTISVSYTTTSFSGTTINETRCCRSHAEHIELQDFNGTLTNMYKNQACEAYGKVSFVQKFVSDDESIIAWFTRMKNPNGTAHIKVTAFFKHTSGNLDIYNTEFMDYARVSAINLDEVLTRIVAEAHHRRKAYGRPIYMFRTNMHV